MSRVRTLDLALLQAGAGVKGEFENRLKNLINEVKASPTPIILFIDEAHTMIGAGGQAGQNDAANLLKPALARGELRTIAATTWSEYKKFFEKDPALARRFQVVKVEEPGEEQCMVMLRGMVPALEKHHKVRILDEGLDARGAALASLPAGPAVARQGGQRSGYGLRPACAGTKRDAAARSRTRRGRWTIWRYKRAFWSERANCGADHGERLARDRGAATADRSAPGANFSARWERSASWWSASASCAPRWKSRGGAGGVRRDGSGARGRAATAGARHRYAAVGTGAS